MRRVARRSTPTPVPDDFEEHIVDIDVGDEMRTSFLEYAYSVIYSRALPDARDGLKPVQRRILYTMDDMGLRPDRGHVKCARVVGEVMGRLHPHGDGAIYDALVRMVQPWSMRLPMVDGHGNFGSPDAGPAAMRYTECRMAPAAMPMTDVHRRGHRRLQAQLRQPRARAGGAAGGDPEPARQRRLRDRRRHGHQHGAAQPGRGRPGAAPPRHPPERRPRRPDAVRPRARTCRPAARSSGSTASATPTRPGRGSFRMRATARIESVTPRRKGIVVTELPYGVGPEKVIERIKSLVQAQEAPGHRRRQGPHRPRARASGWSSR